MMKLVALPKKKKKKKIHLQRTRETRRTQDPPFSLFSKSYKCYHTSADFVLDQGNDRPDLPG
jgi:hypothetical protein